ncbi:hypothetical protein [Polyangium sp. 15x6]|uniref:hypothetical protein n=1 Tax=Polyangium sp. 15x6 TaxID=3042687 RepID=UPI00249C5C40|nr:hypothetical protein [Polyangium sp. 15x6]MDI3285138.1 hypothetical protein [Polyangium sp. 15x6]
MCNPRRVEVTATRAIVEAWEREVRRAASRTGTVRGEVRIRQSLAGTLGAPALAALERALDAGDLAWREVPEGYRYEIHGGWALYSPDDRSLTIVATQSEEVVGRGEAERCLSGRVEERISARGMGAYYDDGYNGRTRAAADAEARASAEVALDAEARARVAQVASDAEAVVRVELEAEAARAAEADFEARAATRQAELQRQVEARADRVFAEARRAFHALLARAYRDALLAMARHRGAQGISVHEDGDVLEIEFELPR